LGQGETESVVLSLGRPVGRPEFFSVKYGKSPAHSGALFVTKVKACEL